MSVENSIESKVDEILQGVQIEKIRAQKKIRDALTGTFVLREHEINLLDLPIVQRLRRIHQNSLASLTYPCATHNRFQHTLGVMNIITKMCEALKARKEYKDLINENDVRELRIAALLHDVGHGPFSHASEEVLINLPEIKKELLTNTKFSQVQSKPHELLSYYIVMSDKIREIIKSINEKYVLNLDIKRIANMIIGDMNEPKREGYISDLLNGPFDADKLDYMPRDAYFSGLKMDVDFDRLAYTCLVDLRGKSHPRRLCVDISGAHNLEQILFNKVLLFSSMYHHHKVRAGVCMIKAIFEIISDERLNVNGYSFDKSSDFISVDDNDLLSYFRKEPLLKDLIDNIRNRQLLKRALVLSRNTVKDRKLFENLIKLSEKPEELKDLRTLIVDSLKRKGYNCSIHDLWIDFPKPPSLREPSQCKVRLTDKKFVDLSEVFPADWWLIAYGETKYKGHVFCPPNKKMREATCKAAQEVFKEVMGIEFLPEAKFAAKIYS